MVLVVATVARQLPVRCCVSAGTSASASSKPAATPARPRAAIGSIDLHHVGILCENIERSLEVGKRKTEREKRGKKSASSLTSFVCFSGKTSSFIKEY